VLGGIHLGIVAQEAAVRTDDEGLAADTWAPSRVDLPGAVGIRDLVLLVGEERKVEVELITEGSMRFDVVGADAIDEDAAARVLGGFVPESAGLARSTRGVVLGVEPQMVLPRRADSVTSRPWSSRSVKSGARSPMAGMLTSLDTQAL
jgi:hypothetical protein